MRFLWIVGAAAVPLVTPRIADAQALRGADVIGTWRFDLHQDERKQGPRLVVVRPDSSASYGTETVRWRIARDSLLLALGGEWVTYAVKVKPKRLTLSGGDLNEPVTFERVGPPTPRPDSVPVPPDPDHEPS